MRGQSWPTRCVSTCVSSVVVVLMCGWVWWWGGGNIHPTVTTTEGLGVLQGAVAARRW